MDKSGDQEVKPIEPPGAELAVKEGDSASTRKQKELLKNLSWEQKISLSAFAVMLLLIPLTLVAVYRQTQTSSQATPPQPTPYMLELTPTPTVPPAETVVPAP